MRPTISSLEIRKRQFPKKFRGVDPAEVSQFLEALAEDFEEMSRELDELTRENARLRDENMRHRETEATLKETLLLAQRSADSLRETSEKDAGRILGEAETKAEKMVQQAMDRMAETEKKIRELRMERRNFHIKFQGMLDLFQQVLKFDKEEDEMEASVSVHRPKRKEGEAG
ncbi:MAG TPA: DivIVA domain-containing protein [Thermoanaerobaculia bacterium]|nr:DivIVA domain-containing protein [Thermoanaerobaculia bacterium]